MSGTPMLAEAVVHIVDDDPVVLESIGLLIMSVDIPYKTYSSAADFLATNQAGINGCLILDVRMPGMGGLELQDFLNTAKLEIPIIFISGHSDIPIAVRAMKHGAIEFLQKPFAQDDLLDAVNKAFALNLRRMEEISASEDIDNKLKLLSPRELEISHLLVEGLSAKEIGKRLAISPRTVEYHRKNVLEKTNLRSVVSLAGLIAQVRDEFRS